VFSVERDERHGCLVEPVEQIEMPIEPPGLCQPSAIGLGKYEEPVIGHA
jgi:hypothetical protein